MAYIFLQKRVQFFLLRSNLTQRMIDIAIIWEPWHTVTSPESETQRCLVIAIHLRVKKIFQCLQGVGEC